MNEYLLVIESLFTIFYFINKKYLSTISNTYIYIFCVYGFSFFFLFWVFNFIFLIFVFVGTAKQRIDSGFYLHKAELKIKKEAKEKKLSHRPGKTIPSGLGDMFMDTNPEVSSSSSNSSDEDKLLSNILMYTWMKLR